MGTDSNGLSWNLTGVLQTTFVSGQTYVTGGDLQEATGAQSGQGASAVSGTIAGNTYIAKFNRQDLQNVSPGNAVTLTVNLTLNHNGQDALTQASDTVQIIK